MISVSKLLCGLDAEGDGLRYDAADESSKPQITEDRSSVTSPASTVTPGPTANAPLVSSRRPRDER
jgi:hypothetical protein